MEMGFSEHGRMGENMVHRLLEGKHRIVAWDRDSDPIREVEAKGATGAANPADLVSKLRDRPRAVWVMIPAGDPTEQVLRDLAPLLEAGDAIVDGGNSYYKDSVRRGEWLAQRRIDFVDSGTSGGIWGRTEGFCLMVGGPEETCRRLEPLFRTLAPQRFLPGQSARGAPPQVRRTSGEDGMNARAVLATAPEIRANPLREESVTLKAADPCTFVVFGASGDLTHRKLIPALFRLSKQKLLHPQTAIVGFARREWTNEQFREEMKHA